ncbi:MAG: hypothetical protein GEU99_13210 [Luteitalea sp.]|nr:hypothetical protein [Luteitalea sp.]
MSAGEFVRRVRLAHVGWRTSGLTASVFILALGAPTAQSAREGDTRVPPHTSQKQAARFSGIRAIRVVQSSGARPRFSPDGTRFVFDRKNEDGFWDVYISDLSGTIVTSLTEGHEGIGQRTNGNAIFHPSGKLVVFASEVPEHFGMRMKGLSDPGIGLFSNFWATDPKGQRFWRLTNSPIKKSLRDRTPATAVVNPVFSRDGSTFVWTERFKGGGWGEWRVMTADFVIRDGVPSLRNERVLLTPRKGNYVTAMDFIDEDTLLIAGNPDGQHPYGMDQYRYDLRTEKLENLTNTPRFWEEGSAVAPNGQIVYMTNQDSRYEQDFTSANWAAQEREREYYLMNADGSGKQRLTYFNDSKAPEYAGQHVIVAACRFSPDGRYLAATQGVRGSTDDGAEMRLRIILIEIEPPMRGAI